MARNTDRPLAKLMLTLVMLTLALCAITMACSGGDGTTPASTADSSARGFLPKSITRNRIHGKASGREQWLPRAAGPSKGRAHDARGVATNPRGNEPR